MDALSNFQIDQFDKDVRLDVIRKLAEQAMTDLSFREVARDDLMLALKQFGYDLNEKELELVLAFRAALADAGIDLFLDERFAADYSHLVEQIGR